MASKKQQEYVINNISNAVYKLKTDIFSLNFGIVKYAYNVHKRFNNGIVVDATMYADPNMYFGCNGIH